MTTSSVVGSMVARVDELVALALRAGEEILEVYADLAPTPAARSTGRR